MRNRVLLEPTATDVLVELVPVHTDYYYMHPAQVVGEHRQVLPPDPDASGTGEESEP